MIELDNMTANNVYTFKNLFLYNVNHSCYVLLVKFQVQVAFSTLTADTAWCTPGCIGGLCGAIGADDYDDVYSKPQCRRVSCVPGLSL